MGEKLKKGERSFRSTHNLLALKWQNKREVYMLSTCHSADLIDTKKINFRTKEIIQKPSCIVDYNLCMGAVDKSDMVISSVETVRKSNTWYKKYSFHLLDISIWNAYCLYKFNTKKEITMRAFHLKIIKEILQKYGNVNNCNNVKRSTADTLRLHQRHFPSTCKSTKTKKALRNCVVCAKNDIRKRSRYQCQECDVGLCVVPCFKTYHSQLYY